MQIVQRGVEGVDLDIDERGRAHVRRRRAGQRGEAERAPEQHSRARTAKQGPGTEAEAREKPHRRTGRRRSRGAGLRLPLW
jgi:hypothetical protein